MLGKPGIKWLARFELGTNFGLFGTLAHHVGIAALAQRECQRVNQDRLAGAGLAGEHREAALELEFEALDDHKIADA